MHYLCVSATKRCQQRSLSILGKVHICASTRTKVAWSSKEHGKHIRILDKVQHAAVIHVASRTLYHILWHCSNGSHKCPDNV